MNKPWLAVICVFGLGYLAGNLNTAHEVRHKDDPTGRSSPSNPDGPMTSVTSPNFRAATAASRTLQPMPGADIVSAIALPPLEMAPPDRTSEQQVLVRDLEAKRALLDQLHAGNAPAEQLAMLEQAVDALDRRRQQLESPAMVHADQKPVVSRDDFKRQLAESGVPEAAIDAMAAAVFARTERYVAAATQVVSDLPPHEAPIIETPPDAGVPGE